jgi:exodeoxyribonuclease VII small subunit
MTNTPGKKPEPPRKFDFEKSIARLEEIVQKLETAELSLDDAMKLFEEGVKLSAECQKQLTEVEGRIEILMKKAAGKMELEPFDTGDEENN